MQQLEETKQENEQLSKTLVEANNAVVETIEVLGKQMNLLWNLRKVF